MNDALLPCPFCGGRNPGLWHQDVGVKSFPRVNCGACGSGTGLSPKWTDADAITAWNTRAIPAEVAALRAEVARLREALGDMLGQWGQEPCPVCGGDCGSANPPISMCPLIAVMRARAAMKETG